MSDKMVYAKITDRQVRRNSREKQTSIHLKKFLLTSLSLQ
jgi:hypothetical protein